MVLQVFYKLRINLKNAYFALALFQLYFYLRDLRLRFTN